MPKFRSDTVKIDEIAPNHYQITGHVPRRRFIEGQGHVVPSGVCDIPPEVPSEALQAILDERKKKEFKDPAPEVQTREEVKDEVREELRDEVTEEVRHEVQAELNPPKRRRGNPKFASKGAPR